MLHKLESLRGIAACMVVLFHSPFSFGETSNKLVSNSFLFVDFFFVLSGFVMSLAYAERINGGLPFKNYLFLRLGRLFPLHFFLLIVWVAYLFIEYFALTMKLGAHHPFQGEKPIYFLSNLFLLHGMGIHNFLDWNYPSWSISTELFSYIFFFLLIKFLDKKLSLTIPLLVSFGCYGLLHSLHRTSLDITYDFGFFRCLGGFYLGILTHRLFSMSKFKSISLRHIWIIELFSITLVLVTIFFSSSGYAFAYPALFAFGLAIFTFSHQDSGLIGKFLLIPMVKNVGTWSYSIYMIHALIIDATLNVGEHLLGWRAGTPLGIYSIFINTALLAGVILISKVSFNLIEQTFRQKTKSLLVTNAVSKI